MISQIVERIWFPEVFVYLPYCSWRRESLRRQLPVLELAVVFDVASQDMDVVQFSVEREESVYLQCVFGGALVVWQVVWAEVAFEGCEANDGCRAVCSWQHCCMRHDATIEIRVDFVLRFVEHGHGWHLSNFWRRALCVAWVYVCCL